MSDIEDRGGRIKTAEEEKNNTSTRPLFKLSVSYFSLRVPPETPNVAQNERFSI